MFLRFVVLYGFNASAHIKSNSVSGKNHLRTTRFRLFCSWGTHIEAFEWHVDVLGLLKLILKLFSSVFQHLRYDFLSDKDMFNFSEMAFVSGNDSDPQRGSFWAFGSEWNISSQSALFSAFRLDHMRAKYLTELRLALGSQSLLILSCPGWSNVSSAHKMMSSFVSLSRVFHTCWNKL